MTKFITAAEAANLIKDNDIVGIGGMGLVGWPEEIGRAVAARYKDTKHPQNITVRQACTLGERGPRGIKILDAEGLIGTWVASIFGPGGNLTQYMLDGKINCFAIPQGVAVNLWREIAARRPGVITKVGLGTFIDPRVDGGRVNSATKGNIAELLTIDGEEYLFFKSFPVNVALIRGTAADVDGNITLSKDGCTYEALPLAMAAKSSGGVVIAQVETVEGRGSLHPKSVEIPGVLVDYIVEATDSTCCWQCGSTYYNPAYSGDERVEVSEIPPLPLDSHKVIARRCAMELNKGNVVNLGIGIPCDISSVAAEEGVSDDFILSTEAGTVGGVPAPRQDFGCSFNAQAIMRHNDMFDLIDGGNLDVTCLGMGEADVNGNVNVSKFKDKIPGPGGFINITAATKKVVFAGTFMAKSREIVGNGRIEILDQGKYRKFVTAVEQITFSAAHSDAPEVLYVTERAVFRLVKGKGLELIEIAPGIDIDRDILANMDFTPAISDDLKIMDAGIFSEKWGKLKEYMED